MKRILNTVEPFKNLTAFLRHNLTTKTYHFSHLSEILEDRIRLNESVNSNIINGQILNLS